MSTITLRLTVKEAAALHEALRFIGSALARDKRPNADLEDRVVRILELDLTSAGAVHDENGWSIPKSKLVG